MARVRPAAVAGHLYPRDATTLAETVDRLLATAADPTAPVAPVKALIAPHGSYADSGAMAALAYAALLPARDIITRVVLLGPTHRVAIDGLAVPGADLFATPLGQVPVARLSDEVLTALPQVHISPAAHVAEHSLEVQLPFLQRVLREFELIPLAVGRAAPAVVAEVMDALWGGPETVVVVSSNLSHYHPYAVARRLDEATARHLLALQPDIRHVQACGAAPVNGLLVSARAHRLRPRLLDQCNSGDAAGGRERVVGYASLAFDSIA